MSNQLIYIINLLKYKEKNNLFFQLNFVLDKFAKSKFSIVDVANSFELIEKRLDFLK